MAPPVVGKRYKVYALRKGDFVGRCVSSKGEFWHFKLETFVEGMSTSWEIGDVMSVRATLVGTLQEFPLDAQG